MDIAYHDPIKGMVTRRDDNGLFSAQGLIESEYGWLHHVRDPATNRSYGCQPLPRFKERWIALMERGGCNFHKKIENAATKSNASAVIIYNDESSANNIVMKHRGECPI